MPQNVTCLPTSVQQSEANCQSLREQASHSEDEQHLIFSDCLKLNISRGASFLISNLKPFNRTCPLPSQLAAILPKSNIVIKDIASDEHIMLADELTKVLGEAVRIRVDSQSNLCGRCIRGSISAQSPQILKSEAAEPNCHSPLAEAMPCLGKKTCGHSRVAVLFSGGIDSLMIAALADRYLNMYKYF